MKYAVIIIAISVIVSIIVGMIWLWPTYQEFNKSKDQLAQKEIELANQNKYIQQLREVDQQLDEKEELVGKINNVLPMDSDIPSLLDFFQESANQTGVSLEDIGWHELIPSEEAKTRIREYSIRITASGSYSAFKNFLFTLERSARLIDAIQTDISLALEPGRPMSIDVILRVRSY